MSGTSGRRRDADCGIRWSTAGRWAPIVRTSISRRTAGAGKRALTEYPRPRLALSLGIVLIGGGGTARGDAIRVRPLLSLLTKARARAITRGSFPSADLLNSTSLSLLARVASSSSKPRRRNLRDFVVRNL